MKRRDFIKRSVPATMLPMMIGGLTFKAYGSHPILEKLLNTSVDTDHVLVVIQMNGGNDGLNMVIPLDQYSAYSNARSNIAIVENKVLKLTNATGLHPAMTGLKSLYSDGKVAVVQSVGYPNPNFSHFRATDIWLTGDDYNQYLKTGWMGRYLDQEFPNFPIGYPNTTMPDPLAIQIGSAVSTGLQGPTISMGMAITNPSSFYNLVNNTTDPAPNTPAGHELTYIRLVAEQTNLYASSVKTAAGKATNKSTLYPASGNSLSDQLKIVARLVAGGLKTRVYIVNIGGFDTHSAQTDQTDTSIGNQATLLQRLSVAIQAFMDDIKLLGVEDRVVGMTFSEFGRRIKSNQSRGTDHGAAAPLFVFGGKVKGAVLGQNPTIPASATVNDNIPMQFDFRNVYASLLKDWFGVEQTELDAVLKTPMFKLYQFLPLIKTSSTAVGESAVPSNVALYQNYPNPVAGGSSTQIRFMTDGSYVQIKVFDNIGREMQTLVDGVYEQGEHTVQFYANGLPSGTYYYRMQNGNYSQVKTMSLVK